MKVLQGLGVFVLGVIISYAVALFASYHGNDTSTLMITLIFIVCYLAGVIWVAALKIIEAIKQNEIKNDQNSTRSWKA
jgi:hypothetical protein